MDPRMQLTRPAMLRLAFLLGLFGLQGLLFGRAQAQDNLIDMFRTARVQAQAEKAARTSGLRMAVLAPYRLALPSDTFFAAFEPVVEVPTPVAQVEMPNPFLDASWDAVSRLQRGKFEQEYGDTRWSYLGGNTIAWIDTVWTRELRARLETRFGRPTRTLLDFLKEKGDSLDEYIQFQYWIVVNDSIPVMVMDVGGPFDRSIVLASDERYRPLLPQLRAALSEELTRSNKLETYVDYYYDPEVRAWYQTGYDGARFYTERAGPPPLPRSRSARPAQ